MVVGCVYLIGNKCLFFKDGVEILRGCLNLFV